MVVNSCIIRIKSRVLAPLANMALTTARVALACASTVEADRNASVARFTDSRPSTDTAILCATSADKLVVSLCVLTDEVAPDTLPPTVPWL
ncbi:Uncharacterised protein [Yersinia pekkanenii]|uniref:Lipoprotein n=1 Tax=Yersinia pekkanenii TaxID=1288385 RepID=A0A0T9RR97_9GAMM|nr:Uncharacterised protein [Yersinia pekkanenii]